jgi:hypothetical protein
MGIRTRVGSQGFLSEDTGPNGSTSFHIDPAATATTGVLSADIAGRVTSVPLAQRIRYEFHNHSIGTQQITSSYTQLLVNGVGGNVNSGLSCWNTASSVFFPESTTGVYTLRYVGWFIPPNGNGVLHVDFVHSGANNVINTDNVHEQGFEYSIRAGADHVNVTAIVTIYSDATLFASGGIFLATSTISAPLLLVSSAIFIKEG